MKLQFKHQKFQADAAKAVCDVFAGQPFLTPSYMMDKGYVKNEQMTIDEAERFTGFGNSKLAPELNDGVILENINKIQRITSLSFQELEGRYNLRLNWKRVGQKLHKYQNSVELNNGKAGASFILVVPALHTRRCV